MKTDLAAVATSTASVGLPADTSAAVPAGRTNQVKLRNVQVLRAYAAFAVVFFHTGFHHGFARPLGRFGVDTFFVISGFMMAYICATNPRNFFLRRVARIVPLYWLSTLAVCAVALVAPELVKATRASFPQLLESLFFIPFVKSFSGANAVVQPMLFVGWSINYEMYFYAVIALALLATRRYAAILSAAVLLAIFFGIRLLHVSSPVILFYSQPMIFLFLLGMVTFWIFHVTPPEWVRRYRYLTVIAGLAAIVSQSLIVLYGEGNLLLADVAWQMAAMVMVLCAVLLDRIDFSVNIPVLILLGDASYATYLIHFYFIDGISAIGSKVSPVFHSDAWVGMICGVLVAHLVGVAVYLALDKPLHTRFRRLLD
jgi:peptidoglycan/LPS O-acetylase OafA/YrhL